MIHPSAVVHPRARIGEGVRIGPCAVIDEHVVIGPDCDIGPQVYLTGATELGARNRIHAGAVIGDVPQDLRFAGGLTGVILGSDNVIREHVTIHRSSTPEGATRLGSHNFLMAHCHVAHNAVIGDRVIIANGTLLGGHCQVGDRAFLSGNCLVHQFTRIGPLALMQGSAAISQDLPPYTIATLHNRICGLNVVGLRRAGFTSAERLELRRLYHTLFRADRPLRELLPEAAARFTSEKARVMIEFLQSGRRGFCADTRGAAAEDAGEE